MPKTIFKGNKDLLDLTTKINQLATKLVKTRERMVDNAILIGEYLTQMKNTLPHGEFGKWCAQNIQIRKSRRADYMKLAEAYRTGALYRAIPEKAISEYDGGIKGILKLVRAAEKPTQTNPKETVVDDAQVILRRERNAIREVDTTIRVLRELGKKACRKKLAEELVTYLEKRTWFLEKVERLMEKAAQAEQSATSKTPKSRPLKIWDDRPQAASRW